jgi:hypothetical protein
MNQIKAWPHLTIVAVLVALVAGLGVAFYLRHEQSVQAHALPNAARIQRVDGEVAFSDALNPSLQNSGTNTQWIAASANQPFSVGDRIYTRDNAHASLAFTGRNFARLNPNTELDVLDLSDGRTQLALRDGSAIFDVGYLAPGELFEVGTPYGAVDFDQPGLYNVGFDNNGSVLVSVLSGLAQVVGLGGSGRIDKGEMLTLLGATAAQAVMSRLNGNDAGYLVDDYYRYQYPNVYDGRYNNYDVYLNDPYYYDPYRNYSSYQYVSSYIPGINDLDYYGDWRNLDGYGYAWQPRADAGWVPYQQGYWVNDYPYGLTWVSSEPWGYAPYHYGRWVSVGNQWYWVPESVNTTPLYSPALVAFLPFNDANQIGWVPLGPGDVYAPRYYDANWQPYYLTQTSVYPTQLVNLAVPNAVTVVPVDSFGRAIDPRVVTRVNPQMLTQVRPTLEPLLLTPLRNAALHSAWGRGKIDLPPGIAKKLDGTQVFVGSTVPASPFRKDLAKALRVESVPDKVKNQKLNVRDDRRAASDQAAQAPGQLKAPQSDAARKQQAALAAEAAKGNRDARRQIQQLEQQQRKQEMEQQQAQRRAAQQAQGTRVSQPAARKPEKEIIRPQAQRPQAEPRRVQPEPRRAAPVQPRFEPRPQPQVMRKPEQVQQPKPVAPQRQAAPQPRPQVQQRQGPPQQQQAAPAQKPEPRRGPPAQQQAQPQGQGPGGGKGKGKKP